MEVLKVSSRSNPNSVAGAMAGVVRQAGAVEVQVVGAGALNQAIKAMAIARGYLAPSGVDLTCVPTFADIEIDGESRTAIRLLVECRATASHSTSGAATLDLGASGEGSLPDRTGTALTSDSGDGPSSEPARRSDTRGGAPRRILESWPGST
jgi:stage V sporulation protein S